MHQTNNMEVSKSNIPINEQLGLIIDNFAGGGGASRGIEQALQRFVDVAVNHEPDAIRMHEVNHPNTRHYLESVWDVDPVTVCNGSPVDLAWFSPDCTHHSKARGGKPKEKSVRGLAWVVLRWALAKRPTLMFLENVEEFKTWGPLDRFGLVIDELKGQTFEAFIKALTTGLEPGNPTWPEIREFLGIKVGSKEEKALINGLGYCVDWRELSACDYGAPTTRNRLFMVIRCDGKPINWPEKTHGNPDSPAVISGKLKPWRTAAEIIDWSIDCPSIYSRKKPLAENTLRRIFKGIRRYVIDTDNPFIIRIGHTGWNGDGMQYSLDQPLTTITSKNEHCLVEPKVQSFASYIIKLRNGNIGHSVNEPLHTITSGGLHFGEVRAFLLKYYGSEQDGCSINEPIHTIPTKDRFAVAEATCLKQPLTDDQLYNAWWIARMMEQYHEEPASIIPKPRPPFLMVGENIIVDIGMRMFEPHELFAGQGFGKDYIHSHDSTGKKFTKKAQVGRCGNSVSPYAAEALVRANTPLGNSQKKAA
ncbi:DNA cytosine methyltransferase [Photobacterium chitinilyticum]|uniref:DNA cytosine methyltransferase n=1 Tax=Photobacterium chitinilyticum TaxID=2485123 RepID=UPI003D0AF392